MPYDFKLTTTIPAPAQAIYDAWLDSLAHSEMTQAEAKITDEVGADFSAWDGYISGRNLELVPGERIVQSWRTSEFADEHDDSIVTVVLEEVDGGTLLTLLHTNVPDEQTSYEQGGWQEHYFEPMMEYFSVLGQDSVGAKAKAKRGKTKAKGAASKTKRKPVATKNSKRRAPKRATTAKGSKPGPAKKARAKVRGAKKASRSRRR